MRIVVLTNEKKGEGKKHKGTKRNSKERGKVVHEEKATLPMQVKSIV
jgi:hypothetical protein